METTARTTIATRMAQLEELWGNFDELFASFRPDEWARRHGPDWTFADVPYHMYFFDQEFVATPIARGADVPLDQQVGIRTFREMHAWSAKWFAQRPADQTPEQSIAQMRASRAAIRQAVGQLHDADLDRPVWIDLVSTRGWRTVGFALWMCLIHTWNEFMQLRLYAGRATPEPDSAITHTALDGLVRIGQIFLDREQATTTAFTLVREYTGPGGGVWTLRIADGRCTVTEGRPVQADLVMTQSVETFVKLFNDMLDPKEAIQSGAIQVSHPEQLATLGQLFPPPKPDQVIEPLP